LSHRKKRLSGAPPALNKPSVDDYIALEGTPRSVDA
jgi:hypothetical protein